MPVCDEFPYEPDSPERVSLVRFLVLGGYQLQAIKVLRSVTRRQYPAKLNAT